VNVLGHSANEFRLSPKKQRKIGPPKVARSLNGFAKKSGRSMWGTRKKQSKDRVSIEDQMGGGTGETVDFRRLKVYI
jgi:hypothetical protein